MPFFPPLPPLGLFEELAIEEDVVQVGLQVPPADRKQEVCSFPPPKRGRGQVQEEAKAQRGLLRKVATGVELKHHWAKREGSPGDPWRNSSG